MIFSRKLLMIVLCGLLLLAGSIIAGKTSKSEKKVETTVSKSSKSVSPTAKGTTNSESTSNEMSATSSTNSPQSNVRSTNQTPSLTTSTATGEQINWQVISSGGNRATSTNFVLNSTVGQTAVGLGSSTNYGIQQGFWVGFNNGCCINRGNVDSLDGPGGPIDVSDLTYLVAYLFQGGSAPPCEEQGNVDSIVGPGGPIDVSDLTYLVAYLFQGGPTPPAC